MSDMPGYGVPYKTPDPELSKDRYILLTAGEIKIELDRILTRVPLTHLNSAVVDIQRLVDCIIREVKK